MVDVSTVGMVPVPETVGVGNMPPRAFRRRIVRYCHYYWHCLGTVGTLLALLLLLRLLPVLLLSLFLALLVPSWHYCCYCHYCHYCYCHYFWHYWHPLGTIITVATIATIAIATIFGTIGTLLLSSNRAWKTAPGGGDNVIYTLNNIGIIRTVFDVRYKIHHPSLRYHSTTGNHPR